MIRIVDLLASHGWEPQPTNPVRQVICRPSTPLCLEIYVDRITVWGGSVDTPPLFPE
jgi:hypothetical protein